MFGDFSKKSLLFTIRQFQFLVCNSHDAVLYDFLDQKCFWYILYGTKRLCIHTFFLESFLTSMHALIWFCTFIFFFLQFLLFYTHKGTWFFDHELCREVIKVIVLGSVCHLPFLLDFVMFWNVLIFWTHFDIFRRIWTFSHNFHIFVTYFGMLVVKFQIGTIRAF